MYGNIADVGDGQRVTAVGRFVSKRTVDAGGASVTRLLVEQAGDRWAVLLGPSSAVSGRDWRTGRAYRLSGFRGVHPRGSVASATDAECPGCGGGLRQKGFVDTLPEPVRDAIESLGLTEPALVADEESERELAVLDALPEVER